MNQRRWLQTLLDHQIPVGVVSLSDKWQKHRYRLIPDENRYPDLGGFAKWHHQAGRHLIAWWGLWNYDGAPKEWCIRDQEGNPVVLDPENPEFRAQVIEDITRLLSPDGYDLDGFFIDFTGVVPLSSGYQKSGNKWGLELLHEYLLLIYETAKKAKPDAMVMTNCPHPYFADVTDVLRLNDWSYKEPNILEQARYRSSIARAVSDWLINTDNWWMYDIGQWREYMLVQPELGIPATWHTQGVWGEGTRTYESFTEEDYKLWADRWIAYRQKEGLQE
ncbi:MAG: hypothetical protein H7X86_03270 [Gorillibacterium sp.]|nr:hypothetical protein [Gorillibacterium sp.]